MLFPALLVTLYPHSFHVQQGILHTSMQYNIPSSVANILLMQSLNTEETKEGPAHDKLTDLVFQSRSPK